MPAYSDRQFQRDLAEFERIRNKSLGVGGASHGTKPKGAGMGEGASWNCGECGYFNFASRRSCRKCPTPRPRTTDPSTAEHYSFKGNGGGKGTGGKGAGKKNNGGGSGAPGNDGNQAKLLSQIKALEERNKALAGKLAEKSKCTEGDEDDPELIEEDDDDDPLVSADLEQIQTLQKLYDSAIVGLGADDPAAKAMRARLDAARAKQRAAKPIFQQVQAAQRKTERQERQLEAAKTKLHELHGKRDELENEISEQAAKVANCDDELGKCRKELGELLERAKAEKGTTVQSTSTSGNNGGTGAASSGLHGAAIAWNAAKRAIQEQVAGLPAEASKELMQAIAAQYSAMEAVLNKLPVAPPVADASSATQQQQPPSPQQGAQQMAQQQQSAAPAAAAAPSAEQAGRRDGDGARSDGQTCNGDSRTGTSGGGDDGEGDMLDVDEATLRKLAEILTEGEDGGTGDGGDDVSVDGNADGSNSAGGRKSRRTMDSKVAAARKYLRGSIPLQKPQLKKHGN